MENLEEKLFKSFGVLWEPIDLGNGEFIGENPFCPNCRVPLDQKVLKETCIVDATIRGWHCCNCEKEYPCPGNDYRSIVRKVNKKYEGYKKADHKIFSLDLPPTQVTNKSEDDNYWVEARIGEKNGKRMAVIYFGEKIEGKQDKTDYSQLFLDFEDEQLRFDKGNQNPMKLLGQLIAKFSESTTETKKAKNN